MKKIITKVLSIFCLVAVLACAFVPCIKLTGDYQSTFAMVDTVTQYIPEEAIPIMEQALKMQDITIDIKATLESVTDLLEPLKDGEISVYDCIDISKRCKETSDALSTLPVEGLSLSEDNPMAEMLEGISEMISMLAQVGVTLYIVSYAILIPVALYGLLAFAVVVRIILRLFNRRGLGVLITILSVLNAAVLVGIPVLVSIYAGESLPFGLESTNVPLIIVGCCIANCIIWAIGRGAKVKKVKEVAVKEEAVAEEVVDETPVVEEEATEE